MKRVYLFLLAGVLAIVAIVVSIMNFNPDVERWSSLFGGAALGFLIVGMPSIISWFKKRGQKSAK
jgi:hypothetical protein